MPTPTPSPPEPPGPRRFARGLDLQALALTARQQIGVENSPPPDIPGYHLLQPLGGGGVGHVYQAREAATGELVAIKIAHTTGVEPTERMKAEAALLRRLDHPNIVRCRDFGVLPDGLPWLAMDYVEGASLAALLPAAGFSYDEAMRYFRPVAAALIEAHARGILHRDLKPSNILVAEDGAVRVADFGLARPLEERVLTFTLTLSGVVAGTAEYLAPECYQPGYTPHVAAEVYALGVLLYELLTGSPPRGAWEPVSHRKKIDIRVDEVLRRALHPDPAQRFASVDAMAAALEAIDRSPPRYAGAALLSRSVRWGDFFWTVLGVASLDLVFVGVLRLGNNTMLNLPLDLFSGNSRYIGTFLTLSAMLVIASLGAAWQIGRAWHFRRTPLRERLPMPFGLALGHSRLAVALVVFGQALFLFLPLAAAGYFWSTLRWTPWSVYIPQSDGVYPPLILSFSPTKVEPVSLWHFDLTRLLQGEGVWLLDAEFGSTGQLMIVMGKASFYPVVEPLLLLLTAAVVIATVLMTLVLVFPRLLHRRALLPVGALAVLSFLMHGKTPFPSPTTVPHQAHADDVGSDTVLHELPALVARLAAAEADRDVASVLACYLPPVSYLDRLIESPAALARVKQAEWAAQEGRVTFYEKDGASSKILSADQGLRYLTVSQNYYHTYADGKGEGGRRHGHYWFRLTPAGWKIVREEYRSQVVYVSAPVPPLSPAQAAALHALVCREASGPRASPLLLATRLMPQLFHSREDASGLISYRQMLARLPLVPETFRSAHYHPRYVPHLTPAPGQRLSAVFPYTVTVETTDGQRLHQEGEWSMDLIYLPQIPEAEAEGQTEAGDPAVSPDRWRIVRFR